LQVYQPDYDQISKLCHMAKQRKLWANHWGNTAFTVEIPENNSQQGEKVHYIQMVQTHESVQLSLGAGTINGVIDADSKFTLRLTPGADGSPREATQTSLREVFRMMEAKSRNVWICLAKRIKWKVHMIFFERSGGNQQPRQVFCGLPRSTGLLMA
jgi:hypothetical protein